MQYCFNPLNTKGYKYVPSEMLPSNQGRMMFGAKIVIQIPKAYIYPTPLSCFINNCGFWPSKITFKVRQRFFTCLLFCGLMKILYIYNVYVKNGSLKEPDVFSKKGVQLQICCIFTEEYLRRNVN